MACIAPLAAVAGATTTPPGDCKAPLTQADIAACAYEHYLAANGAQAAAQRAEGVDRVGQCTSRVSRERTAAIERLAHRPEDDLACAARKP
jgi:hypothetical protein